VYYYLFSGLHGFGGSIWALVVLGFRGWLVGRFRNTQKVENVFDSPGLTQLWLGFTVFLQGLRKSQKVENVFDFPGFSLAVVTHCKTRAVLGFLNSKFAC
jgi:hypothetical protein